MDNLKLELPKELYSDDDVVFYIASLDYIIRNNLKENHTDDVDYLFLKKMMDEITEHRSLLTLWETYMEKPNISSFFRDSPYHFRRLADMSSIMLGVHYAVSPPQHGSYYYKTNEGRDEYNVFYLLQGKHEHEYEEN